MLRFVLYCKLLHSDPVFSSGGTGVAEYVFVEQIDVDELRADFWPGDRRYDVGIFDNRLSVGSYGN